MSFDAWDFQCSGTRLFLGFTSVTYQEAEHLQHQFQSATSPKHNHKLSFRCRYMVKSVMHISKAISSSISPLNGLYKQYVAPENHSLLSYSLRVTTLTLFLTCLSALALHQCLTFFTSIQKTYSCFRIN